MEQEGSYFAEFLLNKGYKVPGLKKSRSFNTGIIDHLYKDSHEFDCELIAKMIGNEKNINLKDLILEKEFPKINKN